MPTYEYQCDACQGQFETFQSIHEDPLQQCPKCQEPKLRRLISGAGIIFKGSGFYANDSKKSAPESSPKKETAKADSTKSAS